MPLKTFVKVGGITNLSDARYCAGMGVDLLGFSAVEGHPDYISPSLYQDIRGWVAGPRFAVELHGPVENINLDVLVESYQPDMIETDELLYRHLGSKTRLPFLIRVDRLEYAKWHDDAQVQGLIVKAAAFAGGSYPQPKKIIVSIASENELAPVLAAGAGGIAIAGTPEQRPGFKSYSELADILESLESD